MSAAKLEHAERITKLGWKVLVTHGVTDGRCTCGKSHDADNHAGKHPASPRGLKDATSDWEQVLSFAQGGSDYNFGVSAKESGFLVIDIDPRNGGLASFEALTASLEEAMPLTVNALSGLQVEGGKEVRGIHLYFEVGPELLLHGGFGKEVPGIDVKHNGYVMLANSKHISGCDYEWALGLAPWEVDLAQIPAQLLSYLQKKGGRLQGEGMRLEEMYQFDSDISDYGEKALSLEVEEVAHAREGQRNSQLFTSGLKIGSLIAGGHIPFSQALNELGDAAAKSGLEESEILNTLVRQNSGGALQLGAAVPRGPERPTEAMLDWAKNSGPSALAESTVSPLAALGSVPSYLNILDWESVFSDETEELWFIPGLICAGRSHVIYADAGLGKSLLVLDICAGLASGRGAMGFDAQDPIKVLYLDHENTVKGDVIPRLRNMGYSAADLKDLVYASFPDMDNLDTAAGVKQLVDALDALNPDLVVIDTVSRTVGGDENSNSTWLDFYRHAGKELKSREIAYIRIDHVGKNADAGMREVGLQKKAMLTWFGTSLRNQRPANLSSPTKNRELP